MATTSHYGLNEVGPVDNLSDDNYKFGTTDRETIDLELYRAATHHHTGTDPNPSAPDAAPTLTLVPTAIGNLQPGTRYYYRYTWINSSGYESLPSPEAFVDTLPALAAPDAPTLSTVPVGGTLLGGNYYYVLSAYSPDSSHDTLATNAATITAAVGSTNVNTVTFPTLPDGAHGFNIYRQEPGGIGYFFLTSVPMNIATPPSSFTDDGSTFANCNRTLPAIDTTSRDQAIQVCVGGATPAIPAGYIWRIYRTAVATNYSSSLLTVITTPSVCYLDAGATTSVGSPPTQNSLAAPDRVLLTNATEVQGTLPMGMTAFPFSFTYVFSGILTVATGRFLWVCDFPNAQIVAVRAVLGRGDYPASQPVIIDIMKATAAATPTLTSIFATAGERPTVPVGAEMGARTRPTLSRALVSQGDVLTCDIVQAGGGATPTDADLSVQVTMIAYGFPLTSFVAGATPTGY